MWCRQDYFAGESVDKPLNESMNISFVLSLVSEIFDGKCDKGTSFLLKCLPFNIAFIVKKAEIISYDVIIFHLLQYCKHLILFYVFDSIANI